jgi:hypothetical protein
MRLRLPPLLSNSAAVRSHSTFAERAGRVLSQSSFLEKAWRLQLEFGTSLDAASQLPPDARSGTVLSLLENEHRSNAMKLNALRKAHDARVR